MILCSQKIELFILQGLYCGCEDGSVLVIDGALEMDSSRDPLEHTSVLLPPSQNMITALCANASQLILGHKNGVVKSFSLQKNTVMWETSVGTTPIRRMEFGGPSSEYILVNTDGSIQTIRVCLYLSIGLKGKFLTLNSILCDTDSDKCYRKVLSLLSLFLSYFPPLKDQGPEPVYFLRPLVLRAQANQPSSHWATVDPSWGAAKPIRRVRCALLEWMAP